MAFTRTEPDLSSALVLVDADGSNEHVLATGRPPDVFVNMALPSYPIIRPSWSPDGRAIALFKGDAQVRLVLVDANTGDETRVLDTHDGRYPQGLGWLGPGSLVVSRPERSGQRVQLWTMSSTDGTVSPLTNDPLSYIGVSVDEAGTSLVTERREVRTSIWVGDATGTSGQLVVQPYLFSAQAPTVSWAGDRILHIATVDGRPHVAAVTPAGRVEAIVPDALRASGSADGSTIVFEREDQLWKQVGDGRPVQLISGGAFAPRVSPNGRHVVFISPRSGTLTPWRVSIDGGEAEEIVRASSYGLTVPISPDSTQLAFVSGPAVVVCDLLACANRRDFALPADAAGGQSPIQWTPDGQGIAYVSQRNIWSMPLDGGAPRRITSFPEDAALRDGEIADFAWSHDGQRLAIVRAATTRDIVLFRGLQP